MFFNSVAQLCHSPIGAKAENSALANEGRGRSFSLFEMGGGSVV